MPIDGKTVQAFMNLYRGRSDAWGSVAGASNKEPLTEEHYKKHLEGERSLGVYPLLDDGTVWFFAIDLDEKDFNKVLAIRQEFNNNNLPVYMAESKSKGFHIYCFGAEPLVARDVRRVCHYLLDKIQIQAECFPKQDYLDDLITFGNYINLPCYGATRQFFGKSLKTVPVAEAIKLIRRIRKADLENVAKQIPPVIPTLIPKKIKGQKRGKRPPCIEALLKGVSQPGRDVAAFAIARHFLDQQYTHEEVLGLLLTWDKNNKPPFGDIRLLETKVNSAAKGYFFGCSSITQSPFLASFCVGDDKCDWLKAITAERKKMGLIREQSLHEDENYIYEEVIQNDKAMFAVYNKKTDQVTYQSSIEMPGFTIVPIYSAEVTYGAVTFPTGTEEYQDTLDLVESVKQHIYKYVDFSEISLEFSTWYIMMSWVYDKLTTVSYLRFQGDTGTGKSRCLDVIGRLSYKPLLLSGAVTPAPIYRLIRRFRGTLVLEEADFRESTEKSEVVTILNCGFERGRPVIRCSQDNPDNLEILPCFGPKVFATRYSFMDIALEARCLTFVMEETDRDDIPPLLGDTFARESGKLRNQLLLWRFRNLLKIDPGSVEEIDLGKELEPRLKQLGLPYAIPFKDLPDVMERFRGFMREYARIIKLERSESIQGRVVTALFKLALEQGKNGIYASLITDCLNEDFKLDVKSQSVGRILRSLNITTSLRRVAGTRARFLNWEARTMKKLFKRYIPDPEDFLTLFEEEAKLDLEV